MLYRTLPVVFWLLAGAVCAAAWFFAPSLGSLSYGEGGWRGWVGFVLPPVLVLLCLVIIRRLPRHSSSVEQCLWLGILTAIAAWWLPTVFVLLLPFWGYLSYNRTFSFRSFLATLIGVVLVAVWAAVCIYLGWTGNPWADFSASKNLWAWVPTGSFLFAYIASTTARRILRVR
mgnify:CR=1 FL=1